MLFLSPRDNGRHAKFATPPTRKPIFSSCGLVASNSKLHGKPLGITVAITEPECTSGRHGCNHRTRVHFRAPRLHSRQALAFSRSGVSALSVPVLPRSTGPRAACKIQKSTKKHVWKRKNEVLMLQRPPEAILGAWRRQPGSEEASGGFRDRFWEAFWLTC